MKITTCYSVALRSQMRSASPGKKKTADAFSGTMRVDGSLLRATADECLKAYRMCLDIFRREWNGIRQVHSSTYWRRHCETLIHSTRGSVAAYPEFDEAHGYMPAYMRRSVISDALGAVSGFMSLHERWEEADPAERGSEPVLGCPDRYAMTFYKDSRETSLLDDGIIGLKLYDGRTWDWHYFRISASDARYIQRMGAGRRMLSPVIERKNRRWHVSFSFEEERQLTEKEPSEQRILAVDLGITAPATWCVMEPDGTVRARGSVRLAREEDRLRHLMNRSRMFQQAGKKSRSIWRMVDSANRELSIAAAKGIIAVAESWSVDCIVFEHLDRSGKKHGKLAQRLHMWRSVDVQKRVTLQAHRRGMRISRVCAWNTSKLAYDGSGKVKRGRDAGEGVPYGICVFSTGKTYSCDLSAAYNIGARYYLRDISKRFPDLPLPPASQRTMSNLWKAAEAL